MLRVIARVLLFLTGWKPEGELPRSPKWVLIAAPHTSNWDAVYLVALAQIYRVRISFMMKHTVFRGPLDPIFRALGAIPIRRDRRNDLVKQMVEEFGRRESFALVVPAEATRSRVEYWKSGFYHIAREAGVPIVMGYLDFARKRGGFGPALVPSGRVSDDMDVIRAFYADKTGRHPERFETPRLREEDVPSAVAAR